MLTVILLEIEKPGDHMSLMQQIQEIEIVLGKAFKVTLTGGHEELYFEDPVLMIQEVH